MAKARKKDALDPEAERTILSGFCRQELVAFIRRDVDELRKEVDRGD